MSKFSAFMIFVTGFAGGGISAYFALKKFFENRLEDEVKSVKDSYERFHRTTEAVHNVSDAVNKTCETQQKVAESLQDLSDTVSEPIDDDPDEPYFIEPEEFFEYDDYQSIPLTLYADGIVADDEMEIVDDPEEILGEDNLRQFMESDSGGDTMYIRNDSKHSKYELIRDIYTYEQSLIQHSYEEDYD